MSKPTLLKADGRTTCCGAFTSIEEGDGVEFCKKCHNGVEGAANVPAKTSPKDSAKAKAGRMLDAASRMAKKNLELSGVGIGSVYRDLARGIRKILTHLE